MTLPDRSGPLPPAPPPSRARFGDPVRPRVLFAGPVGVGKTTAVRTVSDIEAVDTEAPLTAPWPEAGAEAASAKTTTTVGIDYGLWRPEPDRAVAIVGTPGQERFGTVRASVMSPRTRVVLWLFGGRPDVFLVAEGWLDALGPEALPRLVVAVTRTSDDAEQVRRRLTPILARHGDGDVPVLPADPRERSSVEGILRAALDRPEEDPR